MLEVLVVSLIGIILLLCLPTILKAVAAVLFVVVTLMVLGPYVLAMAVVAIAAALLCSGAFLGGSQ